jgi:hypothetical protein
VQSRPKTCQLARKAAALERQTALDLNKGFPGNVRMSRIKFVAIGSKLVY